MRMFGLVLVAVVIAGISGCGGDQYENQFKKNLQYIKTTGEPLPHSGQIVAASPEVAAELEKLKGTWEAISLQLDGEAARPEAAGRWIFTETTCAVGLNEEELRKGVSGYHVDPTKDPKEFEFIRGGNTGSTGIYQIDGDTLKLCLADAGNPRPTSFSTTKGSRLTLLTLKRARESNK